MHLQQMKGTNSVLCIHNRCGRDTGFQVVSICGRGQDSSLSTCRRKAAPSLSRMPTQAEKQRDSVAETFTSRRTALFRQHINTKAWALIL